MACRTCGGAGVTHFLRVMSQNDVQSMPVQQQHSQVLNALSQLVKLSRYGVVLVFAATYIPDSSIKLQTQQVPCELASIVFVVLWASE